MSDEKSLVATDQKTITFYDDELIAIRAEDGRIYVSIRHMADALGLNPTGQIRRIRRQPILADGLFKGDMMSPKGIRSANWLRVDLTPLYLAGIDTGRVKEEIRPKLEKYQREVANVLWEAFQTGRLAVDPASSDPDFAELLQQDSEAVEAYKMLQALVKIARQQILIEARLDTYDGRLLEHENRIETIEAQFGDETRTISEDQASQISQAIKSIALAVGKRSGRNEYGGVYGELYRKFGVTSYKLLPASQFKEAMKFLTNWHQSVIDTDTPF